MIKELETFETKYADKGKKLIDFQRWLADFKKLAADAKWLLDLKEVHELNLAITEVSEHWQADIAKCTIKLIAAANKAIPGSVQSELFLISRKLPVLN